MEKIERPQDYYNSIQEINSQDIIKLNKDYTKTVIDKYFKNLIKNNVAKY